MDILTKVILKACSFAIRVFRKLRLPITQLNEIKHSIFKRYLISSSSGLLEQYSQLSYTADEPISCDAPIWVMWWQGEDQMPPVVKSCYRNLLSHAGKHPVYLLTQQNYSCYLLNSQLWDEGIVSSYNDGKIIPAHLSDLCRMCLLYTYGGIWIDSTVWLSWNIDSIIEDLTFVSGRRLNAGNVNPSEGRWTSYLVGGARKPVF